MGFWSDCLAAIIPSHSALDCQLNSQIADVNLVHLGLMLRVWILEMHPDSGVCVCVRESHM